MHVSRDLTTVVARLTNEESTNNFLVACACPPSVMDLDTSLWMVCYLCIDNLNGSNLVGKHATLTILECHQVLVLGQHCRIVRVGILWVSRIIGHTLAWIGSWPVRVEQINTKEAI